MFFSSINFFINKSFEKHPKEFSLLIFLIIIDAISVVASIISIIPFADFIVDPNLINPQKITKYILFLFEEFKIQPNYFSFAIFFVFSNIVTSFFKLIIMRQTLKIKYFFEKSLIHEILNVVLYCKWSYLSTLQQGKILNIFSKEVGNIGSATRATAQIFSYFLNCIVYLSIPLFINFKMTLLVIGGSIIVGLPFLFLNKLAKNLGEKRTLTGNQSIDKLTETYQAIKLILGFNKSKPTIAKNIDLFNAQIDKELKSQIINLVIPYTYKPLALIILLVIFGKSFEIEKIPEYVGIFWGLYGALPLISNLLNSTIVISNLLPSYEQIDEVIVGCNNSKEQSGEIEFKKLEAEIKFNNVGFNYKKVGFNYKKEEQILENCNISIEKNQITTFIGKTGIGKSTILDLIIGLQKPNSGEIFYDKNNIENLDIYKLRENIGYVPQDPMLFNTSIKDNIQWANSSISENDIDEILKNINAYEFVNESELKLDTMVGERGLKISGGQRQKIALARALAKNPKILVLDEALSSVDKNSATIINNYLKVLSKKTTIVNITHDHDHCKYADKIYLVEDSSCKTINNTSELK